jgi:hypothetical protein
MSRTTGQRSCRESAYDLRTKLEGRLGAGFRSSVALDDQQEHARDVERRVLR